MSTVILHPFVPGHRAADQLACRRALFRLRVIGWSVFDEALAAEDHEAYSRMLASWWRSGEDLLIVEHDVEVSPELVAEMAACASPLCSAPYQIYEGDEDFLAHLVRDGVHWSVATILGATKITARARARSDPPGPTHWALLDGQLTSSLAHDNGCEWHLHTSYPPIHHHRPRSR